MVVESHSQRERAYQLIALMQRVLDGEIELEQDVEINYIFTRNPYLIKSQSEIYKELYMKHYAGWDFKEWTTKEQKETAQRISNIHAVQNTVKVWQKQFEKDS